MTKFRAKTTTSRRKVGKLLARGYVIQSTRHRHGLWRYLGHPIVTLVRYPEGYVVPGSVPATTT